VIANEADLRLTLLGEVVAQWQEMNWVAPRVEDSAQANLYDGIRLHGVVVQVLPAAPPGADPQTCPRMPGPAGTSTAPSARRAAAAVASRADEAQAPGGAAPAQAGCVVPCTGPVTPA
jgi:hypothetical protein